MSRKGKVYLVGAGPGDPGLVTVRARQVLQEADVVIFDALAPVELLNRVKVGCELIDAGKRSGRHLLEQRQIIRLLIKHARAGKTIVRLKGGDPFIFGRGGEEGGALHEAGLPFEVIPGVSSVTAVPAYAGIPLTHRDINSSVTILTGHGGEQAVGVGPASLDWTALAAQEVLVMLMGIKGLERNMRRLQQHGKKKSTPVAVIEWGTRPKQRTLIGTVGTIAAAVKRAAFHAPAVIVIGDVVKQRRVLNWYETKPLFGKHVLVTRARHQAGEISQRLQAEGAWVTEIPTITIEPPTSYAVLDRAIHEICQFKWIIFTSVNGVDAFFKRLDKHKFDSRALAAARLACIGPATADRLVKYGLNADVVARSYRAEGLLSQLPSHVVKGRKVLIPRAVQARDILPATLKKRGAAVTVASAYRSVIPKDSRRELRQLIKDSPPHLLTFASSSMVENFIEILKADPTLLRRARKIPTACIGPITAQTARRLKMNVVIQPREYTIPALIEAIVRGAKRIF